jgi:hypothetical protein
MIQGHMSVHKQLISAPHLRRRNFVNSLLQPDSIIVPERGDEVCQRQQLANWVRQDLPVTSIARRRCWLSAQALAKVSRRRMTRSRAADIAVQGPREEVFWANARLRTQCTSTFYVVESYERMDAVLRVRELRERKTVVQPDRSGED